MFDPGKVERLYVKEWGHHAVYAADYDQLLALYREATSRFERDPSLKPLDDYLQAVAETERSPIPAP